MAYPDDGPGGTYAKSIADHIVRGGGIGYGMSQFMEHCPKAAKWIDDEVARMRRGDVPMPPPPISLFADRGGWPLPDVPIVRVDGALDPDKCPDGAFLLARPGSMMQLIVPGVHHPTNSVADPEEEAAILKEWRRKGRS